MLRNHAAAIPPHELLEAGSSFSVDDFKKVLSSAIATASQVARGHNWDVLNSTDDQGILAKLHPLLDEVERAADPEEAQSAWQSLARFIENDFLNYFTKVKRDAKGTHSHSPYLLKLKETLQGALEPKRGKGPAEYDRLAPAVAEVTEDVQNRTRIELFDSRTLEVIGNAATHLMDYKNKLAGAIWVLEGQQVLEVPKSQEELKLLGMINELHTLSQQAHDLSESLKAMPTKNGFTSVEVEGIQSLLRFTAAYLCNHRPTGDMPAPPSEEYYTPENLAYNSVAASFNHDLVPVGGILSKEQRPELVVPSVAFEDFTETLRVVPAEPGKDSNHRFAPADFDRHRPHKVRRFDPDEITLVEGPFSVSSDTPEAAALEPALPTLTPPSTRRPALDTEQTLLVAGTVVFALAATSFLGVSLYKHSSTVHAPQARAAKITPSMRILAETSEPGAPAGAHAEVRTVQWPELPNPGSSIWTEVRHAAEGCYGSTASRAALSQTVSLILKTDSNQPIFHDILKGQVESHGTNTHLEEVRGRLLAWGVHTPPVSTWQGLLDSGSASIPPSAAFFMQREEIGQTLRGAFPGGFVCS